MKWFFFLPTDFPSTLSGYVTKPHNGRWNGPPKIPPHLSIVNH